jgi:hypothetical protein
MSFHEFIEQHMHTFFRDTIWEDATTSEMKTLFSTALVWQEEATIYPRWR